MLQHLKAESHQLQRLIAQALILYLGERLIEQGMSDPTNIDSISWDDAMILFLCSINLDEEGKPMGIGERLKREKFGRFPFSDGSLTNYLIEFLRPNVRR